MERRPWRLSLHFIILRKFLAVNLRQRRVAHWRKNVQMLPFVKLSVETDQGNLNVYLLMMQNITSFLQNFCQFVEYICKIKNSKKKQKKRTKRLLFDNATHKKLIAIINGNALLSEYLTGIEPNPVKFDLLANNLDSFD